MKTKRVYLIPIIVSLVSILASIVAFQKSNELDLGTLYLDSNPKEVVYGGEYYLLLGNLGQLADTITLSQEADGILVTVFNYNDEIFKEYILTVYEEGTSYNPEIVGSVLSEEKKDVDELDEHLLTVNLDEGKTYIFSLNQTDNNISADELDIVFVNVPEQVLNMKSLMENIAYTSGVFAILSLLTIWAIKYAKKE